MTDLASATAGSPQRVLVAQIGARMHYAVPRILHQEGILRALHTDICAVKGWPSISSKIIPTMLRTPSMKRLFARVPTGIPTDLIRTENDIGLRFALGMQNAPTATEHTRIHLAASEQFCRRVVARGLGEFDCVYVFSSDGLEILEAAKDRGMAGVVEQTIAPYEIVVDMFRGEHERFPDLVDEDRIDELWRPMAEREKREWELADVIVCGSQYVVDAIRQVGGPADKAAIVNYGVDGYAARTTRSIASKSGAKSNVLFVGEVGFRKGSHYLIEAARRAPDRFHFRFCGIISLPDRFLATLPENVELMGIVPRDEMVKHYQWADIFCLPSLVEGSATVTYEAMAVGLPIVTTPNSGSIVREGVDGFIVPPRDADQLLVALDRCRRNELPAERTPPTDREGGPPSFTLEAYRERLLGIVRNLGRRPATSPH